MVRDGKSAVNMIYLMYKNGHTLSSRRGGNKLWVMMDNQYKGKTVIAVLSLEKQDATRTAEDIQSSIDTGA